MANDPLPGALQGLRHREMTAESNGIAYGVWTWTPAGYEESDQPHPLLILLDGEMMTGTAIEAVALQAQLGESKPVIVVGVSTAPPGVHMVQRTIDYSAEVPTPEMRATPPGAETSFWEIYETLAASMGMQFEDLFGGTDAFYRFLTDQLLVQLQQELRIDPDEVGIGGHSSGGDFVVDTLLRKQTPFSKFIVGSFGTDVLDRALADRERAFPGLSAPRHLDVFCGYGGAERADPFLRDYIERGIALIERLEKSDPGNLSATIRGFDRETHGSVISHILSSGIRELWGTGKGFVEVTLESRTETK
ncbi:MAG: hypothetical protein HRU00_16030 [Myxococcales bacterium]|nr:hypothetical protein [Myxococcales bacterium]